MKIRINDKVFEKSLSDEEFWKILKKVKKVCNFNRETKEWVFVPEKALCNDYSFLYKELSIPRGIVESAVNEVRRAVLEDLKKLLNEGVIAYYPCEKPKPPFYMAGRYAILSVPRAKEILMREGPLRAFERISSQIHSGIFLQETIKALSEVLKVTKRVLFKEENSKMIVEVEDPEERLVKLLEPLFTLKYYVKTLTEVTVREIRIIRQKSYRELEAPYFLYHKIRKVAENNGFEVIDEISWPEEKLEGLTSNYELYDFQREAVDAWERNSMFGTVVLPTGAGKTYVGLEAIRRASIPTLVCVVTEELAKQWVELIHKKLGMKAGIFTGKKKELKPITVGIYNSVARHIGKLYDKFGLIIFDEVHHVPAQTFKDVALQAKARRRLGLSATPDRADGNEHLIFLTSGDIVYKMSYIELMERGFLAPLRHHVIYVTLTDEEKRRMARELALARREEERRVIERKYALQASQKIEKILEIVSKERDRKIIIFTEYLDQAESIYKVLKEAGFRVALLTGKTKNRYEIFDSFRRGDVNIIVTTRVLDEGIDVPDADVAIIASGSGSKRQMAQRVGRVLRWAPNKVADVYEIVTKGTIEERLSRIRRKGLPEFLHRRKRKKSYKLG